MTSHPGIALETGEDYNPLDIGLSASWTVPRRDTYWEELMYDQGTIPVVHLMVEDSLENIAAGVHDDEIKDWYEALYRYQMTGRHLIVALFPEMNGNWVPYGQEEPTDYSLFIETYRRLVDLGRSMQLDREHIQWCWAPNNTGWGNLQDWYPGDTWVDQCGMSAYNWGGIIPGEPWLWPEEVIGPYVDEIRAFTDRRICITQTGAGLNDAETPEWLDRLVRFGVREDVSWIWFSIDWFRYGPGIHDFNSRVAALDPYPPLYWFEEEDMRHLPSVTRLEWDGYLGQTSTMESVWLLGRYPIKVQDFWVPAVEAMEQVLIDTGYENPCDYIGSYMKRAIAGTNLWSWHSYGGAIDLDYGGDTDGDGDPTIDKNPHLHRRIPWGDPGFGVEFQLLEHQVKAVLAIRTNNGKPVWRWLGTSIGDTMHFEPACTPDDAKTGIQEASMFTHFHIGDENPEWEPVSWWLYMLEGGVIDANNNSSQIVAVLPWKTNVRLVQPEDFDLIAEKIGLSDENRDKMDTDGLYRWGKELASLRQKAYT